VLLLRHAPEREQLATTDQRVQQQAVVPALIMEGSRIGNVNNKAHFILLVAFLTGLASAQAASPFDDTTYLKLKVSFPSTT
jgi:hypothetical protein